MICLFTYLFIIADTVTHVPHFPPFAYLHPNLAAIPWPSPHRCLCPWATCACACMFFDYFLPVAPTPFPSEICQSVPCTRGDPPKLNLFIKMCVLILTCLNFSHLQNSCHLMQYSYWDFFSLIKTVFELVSFDAFYCFCCFLFYLFHISKMFSFQNFFFHPGKQKKFVWG